MSSKHCLFVGGFSGATAEEIASFWKDFGSVASVTIPLADMNYGFAHVAFRHSHGAKEALSKSAGKRFRGEQFVSAKKASKKRVAVVPAAAAVVVEEASPEKKSKKKKKKQKKSRKEGGKVIADADTEKISATIAPTPTPTPATTVAPLAPKAKPQSQIGAVIIESEEDEDDLFS